MAQEPVKIVIEVEDGVIQNVISCGVPVEYALIDLDAEGNDEADIFQVPRSDGSTADAVGHRGHASIDEERGLALFNCPKDEYI